MMPSSAAPLTDDLAQMMYKRLKVPIKQGYGLSEASPGVATQVRERRSILYSLTDSRFLRQPWSEWNNTVGSAGTLLPSISLKCVDDGKEVPLGETGEIWIRGPNIFKGYYNNPKATAESITPD